MYSIVGKHSIVAASKNPQRNNFIFSGERLVYQELKLKCPFRESKKNTLLVNELCIFDDSVYDMNHILLLDSIEDVGNVGNLIRSASVMGYGVLLRNCPITEKVVEIACGGVDTTYVNVLYNANNRLKRLKKTHFIYGLDNVGTDINIMRHNTPHILIVGSEKSGITDMLRSYCDDMISLGDGVLNASSAGAIGMFALKSLNNHHIT